MVVSSTATLVIFGERRFEVISRLVETRTQPTWNGPNHLGLWFTTRPRH